MNSFIASLAVSLTAIGNPRGPVANFVPDRIAYTLNSYALFEIAYDAYGFNDISFVFDYYVDMEVGKNLFAWQDHYEHIDYGFRCYYNLGYLPDAWNVVLFE